MKHENQPGSEKSKETAGTEPTVTMVFPERVVLNDRGKHIVFEKGANEVPVSLKDHWYLKHNNVTEYQKVASEQPKPGLSQQFEDTDDDVDDDKDGEGDEIDLSAMKKPELVAYALAEFGLELDSSLKKEELISRIEAEAKKQR